MENKGADIVIEKKSSGQGGEHGGSPRFPGGPQWAIYKGRIKKKIEKHTKLIEAKIGATSMTY